MTARTIRQSIRLSADERRRLLEWGPDVSAAVRRVLEVAEAAKAYVDASTNDSPGVDDAWGCLCSALSPPAWQPTTRELVRERMRPGRTATDIARMLGMTRQAVQYHMKRIREGA